MAVLSRHIFFILRFITGLSAHSKIVKPVLLVTGNFEKSSIVEMSIVIRCISSSGLLGGNGCLILLTTDKKDYQDCYPKARGATEITHLHKCTYILVHALMGKCCPNQNTILWGNGGLPFDFTFLFHQNPINREKDNVNMYVAHIPMTLQRMIREWVLSFCIFKAANMPDHDANFTLFQNWDCILM